MTSLWNRGLAAGSIGKTAFSLVGALQKQVGLPTRDTEVFRYIPLRKFYARELSYRLPQHSISPLFPSYTECSDTTLVFLNAIFPSVPFQNKRLVEILSSPRSPMPVKTYSNPCCTISGTRSSIHEQNPFTALNGASILQHYSSISLPKPSLKIPVEILHIVDSEDNSLYPAPHPSFHGETGRGRPIVRTQRILRGSRLAINGAISIALDEAGASAL